MASYRPGEPEMPTRFSSTHYMTVAQMRRSSAIVRPYSGQLTSSLRCLESCAAADFQSPCGLLCSSSNTTMSWGLLFLIAFLRMNPIQRTEAAK